MGYSGPSTSYEIAVDWGTTGLVGTLGYRLIDNVGGETIARTTAGIIEKPNGSGLYQAVITTPATDGQYSVVWDDGDDHWAIDDLTVTASSPILIDAPSSTDTGPCTNWTTGEAVLACCTVEDSSDPAIFEDSIAVAQELLFQLSGRRFTGVCGPTTVRPCRTNCGCAWQVLSRGHIVWNPMVDEGWWSCDDDRCGCRPLSRVLLAGYVQEITEVLINGDVVDPDTYRVDRHRWLVRTRADADDSANVWPGCQIMDLPDSEDGTFSVTYTFGQNPPASAQAAATELACEIYKSCNGEACKLPKAVTRLSRQGVVMEKPAFSAWAWNNGKGFGQKGWNTGLGRVDAFLNAYNPGGLQRVPIFWSPANVGRFPVAQ